MKVLTSSVQAVEDLVSFLTRNGRMPFLVLGLMPEGEFHHKFPRKPKFSDGIRYESIPMGDTDTEIPLLRGGSVMPPSKEDAAAILALAREVMQVAPSATVVIHCNMGVSRSVAAAALFRAVEFGPGREADIPSQLRKDAGLEDFEDLSPLAILIRYGDELLERDGRLVAALLSDR
ncbi:hypothetical protein ACFOY8_14055 [Thalassospira xianhensis]|uniref:Tyrosine specific protein phosphatases domain-containing protein n=1 Tax=Thalassospira xianhensis MCCC 1A02616 TaxID=1177929 RepID=A0A367UHD4_9PROT|nr:hypothetical protein [Thalassospira xianhensis]RCK07717.1 hypothetical protein TH5_01215 [Thalassospira xianhensis MCCC 1A02616]